jgi:hypothetical protein
LYLFSPALIFACSAEGKGLVRCGITSYALVPLSAANPTEAPQLLARAAAGIEAKKSSGKLAPGLGEQLDLQLEVLQDDSSPDLQFTLNPGFYPALCTCCLRFSNPVAN